MAETLNLKKFEIKAFTSTFKDGLLDIFLGIILLQFAIAPLLTDIGFSDFSASAVFIPVWLIVYITFLLIKKYVTKPRIGRIKPGPARKTKLWKVNLILLIILLAGFIIGLIYVNHSSTINIMFPTMFSVMILLIFFIGGYFLNLNRLYLYGLMIAAGPLIGEILWRK